MRGEAYTNTVEGFFSLLKRGINTLPTIGDGTSIAAGDFAAAEESYREANALGHEPQPGLALLRLMQGRPDSAAAAIRRASQPVPRELVV